MKRTSFTTNWLCDGQPVTLPHDAMIAQKRDASNPSGSAGAYFPGGVYTYEKNFTAPAEWEQKHVLLQFEGVYKNSTVTVNGQEAGGAAYGYIPFFVELDGKLNYGGQNTIKVVADNSKQPNSRWYTGGGIYRPVWLWVCEKGGLTPECVRVTTLSYKHAKIRVDAPAGSAVEIWDSEEEVAAGQPGEFDIPEAKLWSAETPYLYTCRVALGEDSAEVQFGIRTLEWSNKGFFVNGQETLLRGGCIHHDSGILGAATHTEAEWRRARLLKEAGYNAIRSAHNPASAAMLDACDYYGLYVMDETWDMWYNHKSKYDYASDFAANWQSDVAAMVSRDYNHPSVIMYSIGNEVSEPAKEKGVQQAAEIVTKFKELDSTRPVTAGFNLMIISSAAKGKGIYNDEEGGRKSDSGKKTGGMNSTMFNLIASMVGSGINKAANSDKADKATAPVLEKLDICGYNYASGRYPLDGKKHPERLIFGSETFPQTIAQNWAMVKQYSYLIGDFMWTAWDYLGEVGIGAWAYTDDAKCFDKPYPWLLADTGAMDILGQPNGELFWAQAVWGLLEAPAIAVQPVNHDQKPIKAWWRGTNAIPSWSWNGCEGKKAVVEVYFDCARVELLRNGSRVGTAKVKDCRAVFKITYIPGKLEAVAYDASGREAARSELNSARKDELSLCAESVSAAPGEVVYLPVTVGDGQAVECNADRAVAVTVEGGELLAFGSANPRTEESFCSGTYTTYYGRALAVVRAGGSGKMTVTAKDSKGVASVTLPITAGENRA